MGTSHLSTPEQLLAAAATSVSSGQRRAAPEGLSQDAHLFLEASESPPPPVDLQELSEEIEDYTQRFNTEDQLEWSLVLQEVAAFVEVSGSARPSRPC